MLVIRQRNKIIEETDQKRQDEDTDLDDDDVQKSKTLTPSVEAISKFLDYRK